jgi:diguanylate cyclase
LYGAVYHSFTLSGQDSRGRPGFGPQQGSVAWEGTGLLPATSERATTFVSVEQFKLAMKHKDEIEQVMSMIDAAIGSAASYREVLADAKEEIARGGNREQLRLIVESLVRATRDVETANQSLQQRLNDSRQEIQALEKNLAVVRTESLTDPLTTLANRKFFNNAIHRLIVEAEAKATPLSVVLTDIDHFKTFNDSYGHLTGDQVLRLVAATVKQEIKGQDIAARYGGEEFAILLPRTALTQAVTVADHIRRSVMRKELIRRTTGESLGRVTISLGVATWRGGDSISTLMERADACLYAAKRGGRNCVIAETALDDEAEPQVA